MCSDVKAFEDANEQTSMPHAPWYVLPSNHQMVSRPRHLADQRDTLEQTELKLRPTQVNIAAIQRRSATSRRSPTSGRPS
jgi:hypothetical protein